MNKNISTFINKHKDMINNNDWEMLYAKANDKLNFSDIGKLTLILLSADINPLDYLDYIPKFYLAYTNISKFDIPNNIKKIGEYAFSGCISLTSITIPNSVTSIGDYAFYNCIDLTSVNMPDSVTNIEKEAFSHCISLTSIKIPDSVTSIGHRAFHDCINLISITIGNNVTSIGSYAFNNCSKLTSIKIPNSVKSIGDDAFYKCSHLENIYFNGYVDQWADLESKRQESYGPKYTVHCVDGDYIKEGD